MYATTQDQPFAYLSTFTRAWEFAAGAVAALVTIRLGARARAALGWLGVVAILWAGWSYTDSSAFPGWIALVPVLGTVAVILAGHGGPGTAGWWLARRPATFVGDVSYSVYLIHWPLIVLVPAVTGSSLTALQKVAILAATVVLAWVSKTYVEDPLRKRPLLAASPRRAYVFAVAGMAFVVGGVSVASAVHQQRLDRAEAATASVLRDGGPCLGPRALEDPKACGGVAGERTLVAPEALQAQATAPRLFSCQSSPGLRHRARLRRRPAGCPDHCGPGRRLARRNVDGGDGCAGQVGRLLRARLRQERLPADASAPGARRRDQRRPPAVVRAVARRRAGATPTRHRHP